MEFFVPEELLGGCDGSQLIMLFCPWSVRFFSTFPQLLKKSCRSFYVLANVAVLGLTSTDEVLLQRKRMEQNCSKKILLLAIQRSE